jgi:hypothetical protein
MRLLSACLAIVAVAVMCAPAAHAADIDARTWMAWPEHIRTAYIAGLVEGVEMFAKVEGYEFRGGARAITFKEMAELVYDKLLAEPELRAGNIGRVAITTLVSGNHIVLADRQGRPVNPR